MTAYLLAALDMAGTTVDEGGLVYSAVEAAVAEAVGGPVPAELIWQWKGTSKQEAIAGLLRAMGSDDSHARVLTVYEAFASKLEEAYGTTPPAPVLECRRCSRRYAGPGSRSRCRPAMPNRWRTRS